MGNTMDVEKFYAAMVRILEAREGVTIKYKIMKKSDLTQDEIAEIQRKNEQILENL